jgi:hypothetical protein
MAAALTALLLILACSQLVKTTKPTGNGVCPPHVERAHEIESQINERAGTRDLDDSDFDDNCSGAQQAEYISSDDGDGDGGDEGDDEGDKAPPPPKKLVAHVSRPDTAPKRRGTRGNGIELVQKLSEAFDPSTQRARDSARASLSFQNTQLLLHSQQVRDAQATIESLRSQMTQLQSQVHAAEMARERAEIKLDMAELARGARKPKKEKKKRRYEEWYPEGGQYIYYVTDPSSDSNSEKENITPIKHARKRTRRNSRSAHHASASPSHSPAMGWGRRRHQAFTPVPETPPRQPFRDLINIPQHMPSLNTSQSSTTEGESATLSCSTRVAPPDSPRALQISEANDTAETQPICSQWSVTSRSPQN